MENMRSVVGKFGALTSASNSGRRLLLTSASHTNNHLQSRGALNSNKERQTIVQIRRNYATKLAEVGKFEEKLTDANLYPPGQPFLHRIFGYRGVTLFPWLARVHDVDLRKHYSETSGTLKSESQQQQHQDNTEFNSGPAASPESSDINQGENTSSEHNNNNVNDESKSAYRSVKQRQKNVPETRFTNPKSTKFHPYYQVLIDARDLVHVSNRMQTEIVTFLKHPVNSKSIDPTKGLDYVAHDDILPYTSCEEQPIQHSKYRNWFKFDPGAAADSVSRYLPSDRLDNWRNNHPWLDLSRVYKETTENVRVTVIPFYLGHTTIEGTTFHWWRYCVRLENLGDISVQLRERVWKISSPTNKLSYIKGRGVVGVEPLLTKSEPAYQYSSHVNLQDKSGTMWGAFTMQREDGYRFECRIPPFSLNLP